MSSATRALLLFDETASWPSQADALPRVEVNCGTDKFVRATVLSLAAEETAERADGDEGAGDVDPSFGVAATRVRRSTSLVIIAGGVLTGFAGISGRPLALVGGLVIWAVVIAGSVWLFYRRRRPRR